MTNQEKCVITFKRPSQKFLVNPPIKIVTSEGEYFIENDSEITVSLPMSEQTITCICEIPFIGLTMKRENKATFNIEKDCSIEIKFNRITGEIVITSNEFEQKPTSTKVKFVNKIMNFFIDISHKHKKVFAIILSSILVLGIVGFSVFALPGILRCDTCGGSDTLLCRACNGKGKEICETCGGNGRCSNDDCYNGIESSTEDCSSCEYGRITNPITWQSFECGRCDGIGVVITKETCWYCDGTNDCFMCDGSGLKEDAKTCQNCTGSGRIDCPDCK